MTSISDFEIQQPMRYSCSVDVDIVQYVCNNDNKNSKVFNAQKYNVLLFSNYYNSSS